METIYQFLMGMAVGTFIMVAIIALAIKVSQYRSRERAKERLKEAGLNCSLDDLEKVNELTKALYEKQGHLNTALRRFTVNQLLSDKADPSEVIKVRDEMYSIMENLIRLGADLTVKANGEDGAVKPYKLSEYLAMARSRDKTLNQPSLPSKTRPKLTLIDGDNQGGFNGYTQ